MNSNTYSPLRQVESRLRPNALSILAWASAALAAFAGLYGVIAQAWAMPLIAFCAGVGVASAYASRCRGGRETATFSDLAQPPSPPDPSAGRNVWQEIDRNQDLLHLLHERTGLAATRVGSATAPFGVDDSDLDDK